jgi:hypothetical protein
VSGAEKVWCMLGMRNARQYLAVVRRERGDEAKMLRIFWMERFEHYRNELRMNR